MFTSISDQLRGIANKMRYVDDEKTLKKLLLELKKVFLKNDVYHKVTKELLTRIEDKTRAKGIGKEGLFLAIQESLEEILENSHYGFTYSATPPTNVLMVGLQGGGKTTSSAKLALYLKQRGKKVLLVPVDLKRLGAVEQLHTLGQSIEVEVFHSSGTDPVSVAKEAKEYSNKKLFDVVIYDTAGRLAIDSALMDELKAIDKVVKPHEILYVSDALSGQDGVRTAMTFKEALPVSGAILSKFDSDSKGGTALGIAYQSGIPIRFLGTGEKVADFEIFLPERIISRLMGAGDMATLAEKTASVISDKEAKSVAKKLKKGNFTIDDFLSQIENIKKMGSVSSLIGMMPGMGGLANQLKDVDLDNSSEIKTMRAIANSMTKKERENPSILNGSRRLRIAKGAGLEVRDINFAMKQFDNAAKLAKKLSNKGGMQELMSMMSANRGMR